jgi:hypothetical protein
MPTEEQMTVNERRKYLKLMKRHDPQAKRGERSRLLTQMQEVTGLHRKSVLRRLARKEPEPQETDDTPPAHVWAGGGAGDPASVGKPGLRVCGTTHARVDFRRRSTWLVSEACA